MPVDAEASAKVPRRPGLRRAREEDLHSLIELVAAYYQEDGHRFDERRLRRALAELLGDPRSGALVVAEEEGRLIGYGVVAFGFSLEFGGRDAFVDELYFEPEFRGQGWGAMLLERLIDEARAAGVRGCTSRSSAETIAPGGSTSGADSWTAIGRC